MPQITVRTCPVSSTVGWILRNRAICSAIAAHIVEPVGPGPVRKEIKALTQSFFDARLHGRKERISRAIEPRNGGDTRQYRCIGTTRINGARTRTREVNIRRPRQVRAGGSNVADRGHNILAQLTLSGAVELLHLRIPTVWIYA